MLLLICFAHTRNRVRALSARAVGALSDTWKALTHEHSAIGDSWPHVAIIATLPSLSDRPATPLCIDVSRFTGGSFALDDS